MMVRLQLSLILLIGGTWASPFLSNAPRVLSNLLSSASASASSPLVGNIADLRQKENLREKDPLEDDDFFKFEEQAASPPPPNFLQRKLDKIVEKVRFFSNLGAGSGSNAIQPSDDDFERDFNADFSKEEIQSGYVYEKPAKIEQEVKQMTDGAFSPANIGVFFVELFGSLVGLVYGAAAQLNYPGATTTAAPEV